MQTAEQRLLDLAAGGEKLCLAYTAQRDAEALPNDRGKARMDYNFLHVQYLAECRAILRGYSETPTAEAREEPVEADKPEPIILSAALASVGSLFDTDVQNNPRLGAFR